MLAHRHPPQRWHAFASQVHLRFWLIVIRTSAFQDSDLTLILKRSVAHFVYNR